MAERDADFFDLEVVRTARWIVGRALTHGREADRPDAAAVVAAGVVLALSRIVGDPAGSVESIRAKRQGDGG